MPFVEDVLRHRSLSVVGLEKNTGKTESFNYLLRRLSGREVELAVTSIGVDGETVDQVTRTKKPEVLLDKGTLFTTSEMHYRQRGVHSELLDVGSERTALGRLITARALQRGEVILSGPSSTAGLEQWVAKQQQDYGAELSIIDGALSRLSLASPAISEAMILATGAALSLDVAKLVRETAFVVELVKLEAVERGGLFRLLDSKEQGIWIIEKDWEVIESPQSTAFSLTRPLIEKGDEARAIYLTGALTERLLKSITEDRRYRGVELIVRDFTRIFVTPLTYRRFIGNGGRLRVLRKSKLLALTVNPVAPSGVVLDSARLCEELSKAVGVPTYDIVKNEYEI